MADYGLFVYGDSGEALYESHKDKLLVVAAQPYKLSGTLTQTALRLERSFTLPAQFSGLAMYPIITEYTFSGETGYYNSIPLRYGGPYGNGNATLHDPLSLDQFISIVYQYKTSGSNFLFKAMLYGSVPSGAKINFNIGFYVGCNV